MAVSKIHFIRHFSVHLLSLLAGLIIICVSTNYAGAIDPTPGPFIPFDSEKAKGFFENQTTDKSIPLLNQWQGLPVPTSENKKKAQKALINLYQSRHNCIGKNKKEPNMTMVDNCIEKSLSPPLTSSQLLAVDNVSAAIKSSAASNVNLDQLEVVNLRNDLLYEILRPGLRAFASLPISKPIEKQIDNEETPKQVLKKFINTLDPATQSQIDTNFLEKFQAKLLEELAPSQLPILEADKLIFGPASPYAGMEINEVLNGENTQNSKSSESKIQSGYIFNRYQQDSIPKKIKLDMDKKIRLLSEAYDNKLNTKGQYDLLSYKYPELLAHLIDKDYNTADNGPSKKKLSKNCSLISNPKVFDHLMQLNSTRFSLDLPMDLKKVNRENVQDICNSAREVFKLPISNKGNSSNDSQVKDGVEHTQMLTKELEAAQRQAHAIGWLNSLIREKGANSNNNEEIQCAYEILQKFALEQQEKFLDGHIEKFCQNLIFGKKAGPNPTNEANEIQNIQAKANQDNCKNKLRLLAGCEWEGSEKLAAQLNNGATKEAIASRIKKKINLVKTLQAVEGNENLLRKFHGLVKNLQDKNGQEKNLTSDEKLFLYIGNLRHYNEANLKKAVTALTNASSEDLEKDILSSFNQRKWEEFTCKSNVSGN